MPSGASLEVSLSVDFLEAVLARPTSFGIRSADRKRKQRKVALIRRGEDREARRLRPAARTSAFWRDELGRVEGTQSPGIGPMGDVVSGDTSLDRHHQQPVVDAACPPLPVLWLLTRAHTNYWSGVPGGTVSLSAEQARGSVRASSFVNQQSAFDVQASVRRLALAAEQDPVAVPSGVRACMFHSDDRGHARSSHREAASSMSPRASAQGSDRGRYLQRTESAGCDYSAHGTRAHAGSTADGAWGRGAPLRIDRLHSGLFQAPHSRRRLATASLSEGQRWHAAYRAWPLPAWKWVYGLARRDHTPRVIMRLGPCRSPQSVQRIVKRFVALKRSRG